MADRPVTLPPDNQQEPSAEQNDALAADIAVAVEDLPATTLPAHTLPEEKLPEEKLPKGKSPEEGLPEDKLLEDKPPEDKLPKGKAPEEKQPEEKQPDEKQSDEKLPSETIPDEKQPDEKQPEDKLLKEELPEETQHEERQLDKKQSDERLPSDTVPKEELPEGKLPEEKPLGEKLPEEKAPPPQSTETPPDEKPIESSKETSQPPKVDGDDTTAKKDDNGPKKSETTPRTQGQGQPAKQPGGLLSIFGFGFKRGQTDNTSASIEPGDNEKTDKTGATTTPKTPQERLKTDGDKKPDKKSDKKLDKKPEKTPEKKPERKPEKKLEKKPEREPYTLDTVSIPLNWGIGKPEVPRVDIIAVHDLEETLENAWTYILDRRNLRRKAARQTKDPVQGSATDDFDGRKPESALAKDDNPKEAQKRRASTTEEITKQQRGGTTNGLGKEEIEKWREKHAEEGEDIPEQSGQSTNKPADESNPVPPPEPTPEAGIEKSQAATLAKDKKLKDNIQSRSKSKKGRSPLAGQPVNATDLPAQQSPSPVTKDAAEAEGVTTGEDPRFEKDTQAGPPSTDHYHEFVRHVHWLRDSVMLPASIPNARVLAYSYPRPGNAPSPMHYLNEAAENFITRIAERRSSEDYNHVPIVLVGHGFGCLVLQRAITILVERSARTGNVSDHIHDLIAGVVFLEAPFPKSDESNKKGFVFPQAESTDKRWIVDWIEKTGDGTINARELWEKFYECGNGKDAAPFIFWFYNPPATQQVGKAQSPSHEISKVLFIPVRPAKSQRLNKFEGPADPIYKLIVHRIQSSLLFKSCMTRTLEDHLNEFISRKFPLEAKDGRGQTPLHVAASSGNHAAVTLLMSRGRVESDSRDQAGKTPLHVAVQRAIKVKVSEPDLRSNLIQVMKELTDDTLLVDSVDKEGKTAWEYADPDDDEFQWIRDVKDEPRLIMGASMPAKEIGLLGKPEPGPQNDICQKLEVTPIELFQDGYGDNAQDLLNIGRSTLYNLIYSQEDGLEKILSRKRPPERNVEDSQCRWIHLPANNEQWVHDLFISMGIQDGSMGGQRHEGLRTVDRYMFPQAKRYRHSHKLGRTQEFDNDEVDRHEHPIGGASDENFYRATGLNPFDHMSKTGSSGREEAVRPTTLRHESSMSSVTSAGGTMTESDAIVIFMPILSFERHRHRKYLTRAFRKEEAACLSNDSDSDGESDSKPSMGTYNEKSRRRRFFGRRFRRDRPPMVLKRMRDKVRSSLPLPPAEESSETALLLKGYLSAERPLHCRRTLDQFSYYMLETTEDRDRDQVAYRWARRANRSQRGKNSKKNRVDKDAMNRPILMVDQLWLWAIHDGTVVTSLPNTWNPNEEFNLGNEIRDELRASKKGRRPILSTEDLVHFILKQCLDFFGREGPLEFKFQECFQSSINTVAEQQAALFMKFERTTSSLTHELDVEQRSKKIETLFRLNKETKLLVEIMDIQEELTIIRTVLTQQKEVLDKLLRLYPKKKEHEDAKSKDDDALRSFLLRLMASQDEREKSPGSGWEGKGKEKAKGSEKQVHFEEPEEWDKSYFESSSSPRLKNPDKRKDSKKSSQSILRNHALLQENINIVDDNIAVVLQMIEYTGKVQESLNHLLDLKQKQANAWEARFAREGSEGTQRQGNIMLVFTLVTIVFLPLSFMTGFFDLSIDAFPKDPTSGDTTWPISEVSGWIFGISALVFLPLIGVALYVNEILSSWKKAWKKRHADDSVTELHRRPTIDVKDEETDDDDEAPDSDKEDGDGKNEKISDESEEDDDSDEVIVIEESSIGTFSPYRDYAPLFGKFMFHTKIPFVRQLWKYRRYINDDDDDSDRHIWADIYDRDYILHRYVSKVTDSRVANAIKDKLSWLPFWPDSSDDTDSNSYEPDDANSLFSNMTWTVNSDGNISLRPRQTRRFPKLPFFHSRSGPREVRAKRRDSDVIRVREEDSDEVVVIEESESGTAPPPLQARIWGFVRNFSSQRPPPSSSSSSNDSGTSAPGESVESFSTERRRSPRVVRRSEDSEVPRRRSHRRRSIHISEDSDEETQPVSRRLPTAFLSPLQRVFIRRRVRSRSPDLESGSVSS